MCLVPDDKRPENDRRCKMGTSNIPDRLTDEVRSHKTPEALSELAEREGVELGNDVLEDIAGGRHLLPIQQGSPQPSMK